jgi:hypothetical protein
MVKEVCDLGISLDTLNCVTTKLVVRVTATRGTVTVRGGVVSESAFEDDSPFNPYRRASVRVG